MTPRYRLLVPSVALFVLLTSCASSVPGTHDADLSALKDTETAWVKDAVTKDLEKFLAHYADDVSVLLPDWPTFVDKETLRRELEPLLRDTNFALTFGADKADVANSGDLGYTQGRFSLTLSSPETKMPVTEKGKYLTVYRKQAGTWKAVEFTFMRDMPLPDEAAK